MSFKWEWKIFKIILIVGYIFFFKVTVIGRWWFWEIRNFPSRIMLVISSETQNFNPSDFHPVCVVCNFGSLALFFCNANRITVQRAQATGKKFFQYIRTKVLNFGLFELFQRTTPKWTSRAYPNLSISQKIGVKRKNNGNSVGKTNRFCNLRKETRAEP